MPTPETDKLLAILDKAIALSSQHGTMQCGIDRVDAATLAELLRELSKPKPPPRDPYFIGTNTVDLLGDLARIQKELRPDRSQLRFTPDRLAALGRVTEIAESDEEIRDTWRWFLLKQPDEFKGMWAATFLDKYTSYVEKATSKPAPKAKLDPRDRPRPHVPPPVPSDQEVAAGDAVLDAYLSARRPKGKTTDESAAELMRQADNAGLEGGK